MSVLAKCLSWPVSLTQMAGAEGSYMHTEKRHSIQDQAEPRGNGAAVFIFKCGEFKGRHCLKGRLAHFKAGSQELLYANAVPYLASWPVLQHPPITIHTYP